MTFEQDGPIVAGIDGSEASLRAVRWAADAARAHRARLYLVHAAGFPDLYIGATMPPPEALREGLREQKWRSLHEAREVAQRVKGVDVHTKFEPDPAIPHLIHASRTARMIVLGASGRGGLVGLFTGSTTLALVSHAHCPVVSVRGDYPKVPWHDPRPVVVGVDGSPVSERAIGYAFDEACFRGVELVAVHTWSDTETAIFSEARMAFDWEPMRDVEARRLAERLAGWRQRYPDVEVRRVLERDKPKHELIDWSRRAQLVVVGSHGRGGFRGMLLGSTSHALIRHAECPVLVTRPA